MRFRKAIVLAAAFVVGQCATAGAADLLPPPVVEPVPIPEPVAHGDFYLRSFIGLTNQEIDTYSNPSNPNIVILQHDFTSSPFIGLGVGYQHSERFRGDLTGEYRGKSEFQAVDICGAGCTNELTGKKSEWLFLANGYWDIGTFRGFTPYVGAGIGTANVSIDTFKDVNLITNGLSTAGDNSEWNFAWALHAGFSYDIAPDLAFDFGYRYTHLGDGKTGLFSAYDGSFSGAPATTLEDISSHDIHVGLRWSFGGGGCCEPEAVPIAYTPPAPVPVYKPFK